MTTIPTVSTSTSKVLILYRNLEPTDYDAVAREILSMASPKFVNNLFTGLINRINDRGLFSILKRSRGFEDALEERWTPQPQASNCSCRPETSRDSREGDDDGEPQARATDDYQVESADLHQLTRDNMVLLVEGIDEHQLAVVRQCLYELPLLTSPLT